MPVEKNEVEKTKIEHQGKLASVCGLLWLVELKESRKEPSKKFHVLTMDDGVEIISWHTSAESREQYLDARGHTITASVKVGQARGQTFFYLQSLQVKRKEQAPEASPILILE